MTEFFTFTNIGRHFDNGEFLQVSGQVEPGQLLMVRGPSGSGKSTLLKILARLIRPETGEVYFHDRDWRSIAPLEWRQRVQYVSQQPVMFEGKVIDNMLLPYKLNQNKSLAGYNLDKIKEFFNELDLGENLLKQDAQTLSGGQAARVAIIRALMVKPDLLLLDEPTAYLDGGSSQKVNRLMQEWVGQGEHAIIEVSHHDQNVDELPGSKTLTINPGKGGSRHEL
jgi:putative ABC transport system ATP-binding protein